MKRLESVWMMRSALLLAEGAEDMESVIVADVVTSQGPGTAIEFALKIVECLLGSEKSQEVADGLVV